MLPTRAAGVHTIDDRAPHVYHIRFSARRRPVACQWAMVLCNEQCHEDKSNLSPEAWERMKGKAQDWKGLHKFGTV